MTHAALDPRAGSPRPGDLLWSALPDAPTVTERTQSTRTGIRVALFGRRESPDERPVSLRPIHGSTYSRQ